MRDSSFNDNGTYLGFKGGFAGDQHGDLDIGSFVYDALGVRWVLDLGAEDYNSDGYWDLSENSNRWNLYRKKAEGHNTLIIGGQESPDQQVGQEAKFIESNVNNVNPYVILDMTSVYEKSALKLLRKYELLNNRQEVRITDTFDLNKEDSIKWQMHTLADIEIVENGKAAILSSGNRRLYVKLQPGTNAVFSVEDANSNTPSNQSINRGVKKLVAKATAKSGSIVVDMKPYKSDNLIDNYSFENDMFKWGVWNPSEKIKFNIDYNIKNDKNKSLKISNDSFEKYRGSVSQIIEDSYKVIGKNIELSQWIKTENLQGDGVEIRVQFLDKTGNYIQDKTQIHKVQGLSSNMDWSNVKVLIPIVNDVNIKDIEISYMYKDNSGSLWVDNINAVEVDSVEEDKVIKNPSFKYGMLEWGEWNQDNSIKISLDNNIKHDDTQSIKIENSTVNLGKGSIGQIVNVGSEMIGKDLLLSQWIKAENFEGNGVKVRVRFLDANNNQVNNLQDYTVGTSNIMDWSNKQIRIAIPNDSKISKIDLAYLYDLNKGYLWIDKISSEVLPRDESIINNNGFEYDMSSWGIWNASGNLGVAIDPNNNNYGRNSLKLFSTTKDSARGTISQNITNVDNMLGKDLELTQFVKTENLIGYGLKARVRFLDKNNKEIESMVSQIIYVEKNSDWIDTKVLVEIPNNTEIKSIEIAYMYDSNNGNVWIDNINAKILEHSTEIVKNSEFEYDLSNWNMWNANNLNVSIDRNIKYTGNKAVRLANGLSGNGRGTISQTIYSLNSSIGKTLNISQGFKSSNLIGNGVKIRIRFLDGNGNDIVPMKSIWMDVKANMDWTNLGTDVIIPNNSNLNRVEIQYLYDDNVGELWIDNIKAYIY